MEQNTAETDAPISDQVVVDIADEYSIEADTVREILETVQQGMAEFTDLYREHQVVAETDDLLITLSEFGFKEEAKAALEEIDADLEDHVEAELATIISKANHAAFRSSTIRTITGFTDQDVTSATSAAYPRIIRKPDDDKPTTGDVDVEYRIQYDHGYVSPFHFNARARATVSGEYGTLEIERTYHAIPDDMSGEDSDSILVSSEAHHAETDEPVNDYQEEWSIEGQLPDTPGRVDEYDDDLRWWVLQNHTGDFEQEYRDMRNSIPICDECDAFPNGSGVHVSQRNTYAFNPARPDTLCNHCYTRMLEETTLLSNQEAEVYALKDSGLTHRQVADSLKNISRSQVGTVMGRIREKIDRAEQEQQKAQNTVELVTVD